MFLSLTVLILKGFPDEKLIGSLDPSPRQAGLKLGELSGVSPRTPGMFATRVNNWESPCRLTNNGDKAPVYTVISKELGNAQDGY